MKSQIIDILGCEENEIILSSAKERIGAEEILETIVKKVPHPRGDPELPLQALIFDSMFDPYRGAVAYIRIFNGRLKEKDQIRFFATGKSYEADEIGFLRLRKIKVEQMQAGDVGYLIAGIKDVHDTKVGDTVTHAKNGSKERLPGYKEIKPMVYSGLYPSNADDYEDLKDALDKLRLNDSALLFPGNLCGIRIRIPLRIFGDASYGNHSGKT